MKKLLAVIFAFLPVLAFAASPNHTAKSTQTKSVKTAVKKVEAKKATTLKTVAKTAKNNADTKKAEVKKPAKIVEAKKAVTKKEKIKNKTTNKTAKAEPTKTKGKQSVEKIKQTAVKDKKTVMKSKQSAVKESAKPEKVTENRVETVAQKTANTVTKSVVVPRCNDSKVFAVLSDAFKKQGAATNTQMTVKQITQARETQSYPQQGIRSCNAIVETNGVKYVTDYSIILNDKGFFVQVENAQPAQRF